MIVLGIETSCDETAVAVVDVEKRQILAQQIYSQVAEHAPYAGVVPEIASRAHLERLPALTSQTLKDAGLELAGIDAVAATVGPGLTTALLVGTTFAKTLAVALGKPFLAANHIEGHALSPMLAGAEPPYLLLLVSGGHTQLAMVDKVGSYTLLGSTLDDAVGEAFDKVGQMLKLPYPPGPQVERVAATGNGAGIELPFPKNDRSLDFSFAGLKTAVLDLLNGKNRHENADIAAAFQQACVTILTKKSQLALKQTGAKTFVAAGGVAANAAIRAGLQAAAAKHGAQFIAPPLALCTDNAAMIAFAAGLRAVHKLPSGNLSTRPVPRHPLDMPWPPATA
ncbi:MAG TPA: tRNA (adenosine(37)-N6)-threonylcarbamoyltransferase complex transferase subunit TsaD [Alphaproteobacteria bacterium]|nr:tRNA (adenosine(37)-N6)-threonylcarbamoyltransferase complex transferase subunit TsaD [Alphaproteobacteria bacterium]